MNKFYYFEGRIFETKEETIRATKNYTNKSFDIIETQKSFKEFESSFEQLKEQGESDYTSIECSK